MKEKKQPKLKKQKKTAKGGVLKEHRVNKNSDEYKAKVQRAYELILQGMRTEEVHAHMLVDWNEEMSVGFFKDLMAEAFRLAEIGLHKDREYTFQLHMERYEKLFEESMKMTNSWGQPLDKKKDWRIIVMKYISAMRALEAKEHLIGLHDKSMVFEFTDQRAVVIEKEDNRGTYAVPGFKLDILSVEEQVELLGYIRQARITPIEGIQRIVVKQKKIEISITEGTRTESVLTRNIDQIDTYVKDITFEEMPENVVKKFNNIPDVVVEQDPGTVLVEDLTDGKKGKTPDEIIDSIKTSALEKLKKKLGK